MNRYRLRPIQNQPYKNILENNPYNMVSRNINRTQNLLGSLTLNDDIEEYNRDMLKIVNRPQVIQRMEELIKKQIEEERDYISRVQICPIKQVDRIQDDLGDINPESFKNMLRKNFYNPNIMKAAMCITDSIIYTQPIRSGSVTYNQRLREWLRDVTQVGDPSVEGYALETDFKNTTDVFIVKVPRDPENKELLHEFFIGTHINTLRRYVPNFVYVLGGFKCSPPVIDSNKEVVAWCNNTDVNVNYILYENIAPAISFNKYSKTCSFRGWLDKYLQILYSLALANDLLNFTHYDLHGGNVLIRMIDESYSSNPPNQPYPPNSSNSPNRFAIPYPTERGGIEYINTDAIATIIDFGFSYIGKKTGDDGIIKSYGRYGLEPWGVMPNDKNPLHDAYKLLLSTMSSMYYVNRTCYDQVAQILKFFNDKEDPDEIITRQSEYYFFFPYREDLNLNIYDLITFIRRNIKICGEIITPVTDYKVIGCSGSDICITSSEAIRRIGIDGGVSASTIFEFYDLVTRLMEEKRYDDIEEVKSNFDYRTAKRKAINDYNKLVNETNLLRKYLTPVSINGLTINSLFNDDLFNRYRESAIGLANLYDHVQQLSLHRDAISYAASIYSDDYLLKSMELQQEPIQSYLYPIAVAAKSIKKDKEYLDLLYRRNYRLISKKIETDPKFDWWWKILPSIVYTLI